jgi:hypothetical protein
MGGGMKKIRVVGCLGLPLEMLLTCQFYFESSSLSFVNSISRALPSVLSLRSLGMSPFLLYN